MFSRDVGSSETGLTFKSPIQNRPSQSQTLAPAPAGLASSGLRQELHSSRRSEPSLLRGKRSWEVVVRNWAFRSAEFGTKAARCELTKVSGVS